MLFSLKYTHVLVYLSQTFMSCRPAIVRHLTLSICFSFVSVYFWILLSLKYVQDIFQELYENIQFNYAIYTSWQQLCAFYFVVQKKYILYYSLFCNTRDVLQCFLQLCHVMLLLVITVLNKVQSCASVYGRITLPLFRTNEI